MSNFVCTYFQTCYGILVGRATCLGICGQTPAARPSSCILLTSPSLDPVKFFPHPGLPRTSRPALPQIPNAHWGQPSSRIEHPCKTPNRDKSTRSSAWADPAVLSPASDLALLSLCGTPRASPGRDSDQSCSQTWEVCSFLLLKFYVHQKDFQNHFLSFIEAWDFQLKMREQRRCWKFHWWMCFY